MSSQHQSANRRLKHEIEQLLSDVKLCFKKKHFLPGLVLLYSTIDILASLDRPESKEDVTWKDFVAWLDAFVFPHVSLPCDAIDLYAARCGLIHTYTFESRLSRSGK